MPKQTLLAEPQDDLEEEEEEEAKEIPPVSYLRLLGVTCVLGGVQFGWALQLALLTPFVQDLGIPHEYASLIWLCGPIAGLVVQPTVGWYSDRCRSKYGRRRPYIVIGMFIVVLAMLLISNASDLGHLLGDPLSAQEKFSCSDGGPHNTQQPTPRPRAIFFFVLGFWILDVSNNLMQGPCRALVADVAPKSQQYLGMAMITGWIGVGNMLGYAAGWVDWSSHLRFMQDDACNDNCANLRTAFCLAIVSVSVCTLITAKAANERPLTKPVGPAANPLKEVLLACRELDTPMKWVCFVMFTNWIGLYCFFLYDTDFFGRQIYGGSPDSSDWRKVCDYNAGVRMGSLGLLLNSAVSLIALVLPRLIPILTSRGMWGMSLIVFAILMASTPAVTTAPAGLIVFALLGVPWAVTLVVPFALVSRLSGEKRAGLMMGVLNIFVVLPQLLVSAINPVFFSISQVKKVGDSASFVAGAACAVVGAAACIKIDKDRAEPTATEDYVVMRKSTGGATNDSTKV